MKMLSLGLVPLIKETEPMIQIPWMMVDSAMKYRQESAQRRMVHSAGYSPLIGASPEFLAENPSLGYAET